MPIVRRGCPLTSETFAPGTSTRMTPFFPRRMSTPISSSAGRHPTAHSTATAGFWAGVAASYSRACQSSERGTVLRFVLLAASFAGFSAAFTASNASTAARALFAASTCPAWSPARLASSAAFRASPYSRAACGVGAA